ncbi:MAG: slipin family protein [Hyphomicrobiales bacterium]|nr:slipin family protein [Hyphomicrobiales bacterium]
MAEPLRMQGHGRNLVLTAARTGLTPARWAVAGDLASDTFMLFDKFNFAEVCVAGRLKEYGMRYRRFFLFELEIADDERAFLRRNGRFEKLLGPGKYTELDFHRELKAEVVKVIRAEVPYDLALMMKVSQPQIAEDNFEIVQTGPGEVAIVSFNGDPRRIVGPNMTRAFWKTLTRVTAELIDTSEPRIKKQHLSKIDLSRTTIVKQVTVEPHEVGLLIIDGQICETLTPGRHAFWNVAREIRLPKLDVRPIPLEVTEREILTKDRASVGVTLTAFYRIIDAVLAMNNSANLGNMIYRLIQFAIREAIVTRALNDILAARVEIDKEVRAYVDKRISALGAEITEICVRDLILPSYANVDQRSTTWSRRSMPPTPALSAKRTKSLEHDPPK